MGISFLIKLKEDDGMRKMLSAALLMCMVALLSTLSTAVHATPPTTAEGRWYYTPYPSPPRWADGNQFIYGYEYSTWTGTFDGTSYDVFTVVVHPSGFRYVEGLIDFDGTVMGKSGSMVIRFVGKGTGTPPTVEWSGQWVILSGTGELASLCGQGTWWGPAKAVYYSGKIHFEPD